MTRTESTRAGTDTTGRNYRVPVMEAPQTPLATKVDMPELHTWANLPFAAAVLDDKTGKWLDNRALLKHPELQKQWSPAAAKEFGRLAIGWENIKGTDTIEFIPKTDVPANKKPTYARFVCNHRQQKADPTRVRLTVGGNLIDYPGNTSSPTADMTTIKILFNDTISTPGARMVFGNVKNFYLATPMDEPECMRIRIDDIPDEIVALYELHELAVNGWVYYVKIKKGPYLRPAFSPTNFLKHAFAPMATTNAVTPRASGATLIASSSSR